MARAIHRSRIPVISAVGHEVDFTIADFVADLRAPTPSAAAELVVKSKEELAARLEFLRHRLVQGVRQVLAEGRAGIDGLSRSLRDPSMLVGHLSQRIDDLSARLERGAANSVRRHRGSLDLLTTNLRLTNPAVRIERARERAMVLAGQNEALLRRFLDHLREESLVAAARLDTLSPLATMARGYSIVLKLPERRLVTDSARLAPGDRVELRLRRGRVGCCVESSNDT